MGDLSNRVQVFLFLDVQRSGEFGLYGQVFTPENFTPDTPNEYVMLVSGATEDVLRAEFGEDVFVDLLCSPADIREAIEYVNSPATSIKVRNI